MNKVIVFGAGSAMVAAAVSAALLGAGSAAAAPSAGDVVGQKYSDASDAISQAGGSAIISSRVGDQVDEGDCLVTNAQAAPFLRDGTSFAKDSGEVMISLNCNAGVASAKDPGNSAASTMGRQTLAAQAEEEAKQQAEQEEAAALEEVSTPDQ